MSAIEQRLSFLISGTRPRKTPTTPYRMLQLGYVSAPSYQVTWRHGLQGTIGTLTKRSGGWLATAQIDGPGWDSPPTSTFRTRAAAAEWLMVVSNVPNQ
jgi:hypothetical protein